MDLRRNLRDQRHRVLLALARRGNEDAFRRLYRELFGPVSAYVGRRVPNREDAEDVTALVFSRFVHRLDGYDADRGSVMTWVLTMARTAVIDQHRRRRPAAEPVDELADRLAGPGPGPLQECVRDEDLRRVRRLLERQPDDIREMFALRFEQGLRVHEVAEVMGLSPDAAKQRFARALRRLQLELKDEERGPGPNKGDAPCATID